MDKPVTSLYSTEETTMCFYFLDRRRDAYPTTENSLILHSLGSNLKINDAIDGIRYDGLFELSDLMRPLGTGEEFIRDQVGELNYKVRNNIHLVLVGSEFPKEDDFSEGSHSVLVNVKLESTYLYQRAVGYHDWSLIGCLQRLPSPQTVSFRVFNTSQLFQSSTFQHQSFRLIWNVETNCWESINAVRLVLKDYKILANESCQIHIGRIEMEITQEGIEQIRQKIGIPLGSKVDTFRDILELELFADLTIICGGSSKDSSRESNSIKCHQVFLAGISEVFGKMLGNLSQGEEMAVMEVKYSTSCMLALMHYAYHGGAQKIFAASFFEIIELLQAAKEYKMDKLLEFATFIVTETPKRNHWFNLNGAFQLFYCAADIFEDKNILCKIREKMVSVIQSSNVVERNASHEFRKIFELAQRCGPVFGLFLETYVLPWAHYFPSCNVQNLQDINVELVSKNEARQLYDLFKYSKDYACPRNPEICIGIGLLADFLDQEIEECANNMFYLYVADDSNSSRYGKSDIIDPDYFPTLFELAASKSEKSSIWSKLTLMAARKIKGQENTALCASTKYKKLINDPNLSALLHKLQENTKTTV